MKRNQHTALARTMGQIAREQGADQAFAKDYALGTLVGIRAHGVMAFCDLVDGDGPTPYVLAWRSKGRRFSKSFAPQVFSGGYVARMTTFSGSGLLALLEYGLKKLADGSAYEPDHRSLINLNA